MSKKILVFNTGSSTLKYKLFELENHYLKMLKKGAVEDIGQPTGPKNHRIALSLLFQGFGTVAPYLAKIPDLVAIGHRVVYGGENYEKLTHVTPTVISQLKQFNPIAPLHNPAILEVMQMIINVSGRQGHRDIPNYAVFDSAFYQDLPELSKIYPLPYRYYTQEGIKRYGFHGISHQYATEIARKKYPNLHKIISLHLGAGCSITASYNGKPIETSMGFSPQEGLMMTTRCGDIDPGILLYLLETKKIKNKEDLAKMIGEESGLLGISGISASVKDLLCLSGYTVKDANYHVPPKLKNLDHEYVDQAKLAINMFCYRAKKYIGAYYAILGGVDALVFTGAIGSGSSVIRKKIVEGLDHILKNAHLVVIETDEEQEIAKEILKVV